MSKESSSACSSKRSNPRFGAEPDCWISDEAFEKQVELFNSLYEQYLPEGIETELIPAKYIPAEEDPFKRQIDLFLTDEYEQDFPNGIQAELQPSEEEAIFKQVELYISTLKESLKTPTGEFGPPTEHTGTSAGPRWSGEPGTPAPPDAPTELSARKRPVVLRKPSMKPRRAPRANFVNSPAGSKGPSTPPSPAPQVVPAETHPAFRTPVGWVDQVTPASPAPRVSPAVREIAARSPAGSLGRAKPPSPAPQVVPVASRPSVKPPTGTAGRVGQPSPAPRVVSAVVELDANPASGPAAQAPLPALAPQEQSAAPAVRPKQKRAPRASAAAKSKRAVPAAQVVPGSEPTSAKKPRAAKATRATAQSQPPILDSQSQPATVASNTAGPLVFFRAANNQMYAVPYQQMQLSMLEDGCGALASQHAVNIGSFPPHPGNAAAGFHAASLPRTGPGVPPGLMNGAPVPNQQSGQSRVQRPTLKRDANGCLVGREFKKGFQQQ